MSLETARKVLRIEAEAIARLVERVDGRVDQAVEILHSCQGRVVVTGMGKSGLIAQKISATFSSTGAPSLFLHPAEAFHGDLGCLARGDVLVAFSYSGETEEVIRLLGTVKRLDVPLISLTGNPSSKLAQASNIVLDVGILREACPLGLTPTASTTASLAMGDAIAMSLLEKRGFKEQEYALLHPGGRLGVQLQRVEQIMHTGEEIPRVGPETKMPDVIYEMSKKGLGITTVISEGNKLMGVVSDGDLRRFIEKNKDKSLSLTAADAMTCRPVSIAPDELATRALDIMEAHKITCLVVTKFKENRVVGLVHIHDLWTMQIF